MMLQLCGGEAEEQHPLPAAAAVWTLRHWAVVRCISQPDCTTRAETHFVAGREVGICPSGRQAHFVIDHGSYTQPEKAENKLTFHRSADHGAVA